METERVFDLHRNPIQRGRYLFIGQEGATGDTAIGPITYSEDVVRSHLRSQYTEYSAEHICLVSHTPPYGVLDLAQRFEQQRIGSYAVRDVAKEVEPVLILCGHVHQFGGQTEQTDYTYVANIASHDNDTADARLGVIELNGNSLSVTHTTVTDEFLKLEERDKFDADPQRKAELISGAQLRQLSQVGPSRAETLQENGYVSVGDLATTEPDTIAEDCRIPLARVERMHSHAQAFVEDTVVQTDPTEWQKIFDQEPVLLDIETDLAKDQVWCVGVYSYREGASDQFVQLDDEEQLCDTLVEYLCEQDNPPVCYYAGQRFDERILRESAERHDVNLDTAAEEWIDLCLLARKTIFVPRSGHELDNIATELGYEFTYPDITGLEVGSVYSAYQSNGEIPDHGWEPYLKYNLDDVYAVKQVLDVGAGKQDLTEDVHPDVITVDEIAKESGESATIKEKTEDEPIEVSVDSIFELLCDLGQRRNSKVTRDRLVEAAVEQGGREGKIGDAINKMFTKGMAYEPKEGYIRPIVDLSQTKQKTEFTNKPSQDEEEKVVCHECSKLLSESIATGKYRINDGKTVWYCKSCK